MNKKLLINYVLGFLTLLLATMANAQSSYFNAITNLNPVGYWPMHEIEPAAPGDIETNYGSLGILGTGYYPDWANGPGSAIQHQVPGALTNGGDLDTAVYFLPPIAGSPSGATNCIYVPHTTSLSTLNPPFTVECWVNSTNVAANSGGDVWSQEGYEGLNAGPTGNADGFTTGIRLYWQTTGFIVYAYSGGSGQNNLFKNILSGGIVSASANQWHHVVVTVDASTNVSLYLDGNLGATVPAVKLYYPDYWTPFEIGNGRGNTRTFQGDVDEVAIYTNVLSTNDITWHYADGTNSTPATNYFSAVTNDNPVIYLRMHEPNYTAPDVSTWPVLTNYGSVAVNGVYSPGTFPGSVMGPVNPSGVHFTGVTNAVPQLSGVSSYADAGYALAYDPTGAVPFSVTAIFRGNPCDGRTNSIIGHSDNSWHLLLNTTGKLQCQVGTDPGSAIITTNVYNDGNWHQLVEVYTPNSNPNLLGTNALYVDGVLDTAVNTVSTNGFGTGSPMDVLIGSDPQYTNDPAGVGQQFAGQVCEVALFTNALTVTNVRALWDAAGEVVPAYIVTQPLAAVSGGSTTIKVTANGTDPLAYQWYFNTSASYSDATVETDGSGISGSTTATLTITNLRNFYFVVITNNYGSVTSAVVTANFGPVIVSQVPTTYTNLFTVYPGFNHSFSISAVGDSLSYQWYTNGAAVAGATSASFTQTNVQASFTNYCIVTNSFGTATGYWAAAVISLPTAPYPQSVLALNPIGYWRLNEPDNNGGNGPNDGVVCNDYIGGNDGLYTNVNLSNPSYSATDPAETSALFGNYAPNNSDAGFIGTNIDFATPSGNNGEFSIEAWVAVYLNSVGGLVTKGYGGSEEACLDTGGAGDAFRFFVRNAAGSVFYANSTIVPTPNLSWYHVVGVCDEANGTVSIYVNGTLAGQTNITSGSGILNNINNTAWPMTIGSKASSQTSGNNTQTFGYMDDVAAFNYALGPGQVASEYDASGGSIAPYFAPPPPTNAVAVSNTTLTVSAMAIGTPPIGYQWINVNTSASLATGVTNSTSLNATLNYPNVPASWTGNQLELIVTNAAGSTNIYVTLSIGASTQSRMVYWNLASGDYTNSLGWLPQIVTPGGITNWPDDANGNGFDYVVILTNNIGSISCLYTNTDVYGTNLIGQLAIGGYGAGLGGGDFSNAFIMTGGQLTVTDFTANATAGYAFTVGGTTQNPVLSTNYFIMNGGTFNSTNSSGGNNWIGYASNTVNTVNINDGIMNLDGLFLGGCGLNTFTINGGTVNFVPQMSGGGSPGVLNMGWDANGNSTLNLISGVLNVNCTNTAPSINLGANRNGPSGFFTFNMSGGTLNAYQIGVGASGGTGNTQAQSTGPETNIVNFSGGTINLGAGGITNTPADKNDTNLFIMSGGTFSTLSPANYTVNTTTANWGMWRGVNAVYILTNQPGPGTVNFAPLSDATITISAQLTGNGNLNVAGPGTVIMTNANIYSGDTIISGGTLSLSGVGSIASSNIIVAGGATFDVSGLSSAFALGSSQTLSNSSSTATISGSANFSSGTVSLTYAPGTPSFVVTNGTLTLSSSAALNINNTGSALGLGTYTLIGPNANGVVAGTVPSTYVVNGGGVQGTYRSSLVISSSNTLDLVVVPGVNITPTNIAFSVTGNQLTLGWPSDHTGWTLQTETNSLSVGISTNWFDVANSSLTNQVVIPINLTNGSVFYRLIYR